MNDSSTFQQKNTSKMAELFMECEEEELEPWQKKIEVSQKKDDDDDDLIFVGEILSSRPAISNILNRGNPGSSSRGIKNEALNSALPPIFKATNQHYINPSYPVAALSRFHTESASSQSSIVQNISKPGFSKISSQVGSDASSLLLFDSTKDTLPSGIPKTSTGIHQTLFGVKHSSASNVSNDNLKMPKTNESVPKASPSSSSFLSKPYSEASSQVIVSTNPNTSSTQSKSGTPSQRSCPKCNIKFTFLDHLKCHMKYCCPNRINNLLETLKAELASDENISNIGSETGKLIMLVSDFYYGRHEGATDEEPKTYATFKCFSCSKVLKNNIRFMNHMKHHLELEKQNSESWENHTTCQHCYRQYPTPFQLQCHIESTHTPHDFSTICKICELSFEGEHILLQHMKDTHKPGEMPYICQVCQFRSSIFSDVETHFRASHENTKFLLCPFCLKVNRMAAPYMNHYMKHQKKGIYRCTKCRLQFLTCKEKIEHKTQHRTFIKPKELEGLPSGTKVTIRASLGPVDSQSASTPTSGATSTTILQASPPRPKEKTAKNPSNTFSNKTKTHTTHTTLSTTSKPKTLEPSTGASKFNANLSPKQKKQCNKNNKIDLALKNLRCHQGIHKCIECNSKIKDFASHFPRYVGCNFCKYYTSCNKAFVNHMMSAHSNTPSKFHIFKKNSRALRGITLVCLKCDFLANSSGLDRMAKHLNHRKTHTCQVIIENVSECTSTSKYPSDCLLK
uniref:zinc finger protein 280C isoform X1 n=1 Tax=Jaculus jaculus TaxID=51337 RepID=UPI001E1B4BBE|nr:zinc finger protein 280C isoform X1 [Jaculus jaculus]XP_044997047.1 zinc finger protein 280C isoform X1 [Jaculus jaculus]